MRLRLRIERNSLPHTQALWPVKDRKSTIAQLLQHINEVFPLEGDTWGLEDYSVSVGGYECLHYHEVEAICKEDDEVAIKPLQWVDVRSRTLTGRDQIASDGRHLVDGVPFGRPCLRNPVRPEVRIPPRKRRRLMEGEVVGGDEEQLMLTENGEQLDEDEVEDDDEDFEAKSSEDARSDQTSSSEENLESSDDSDSSDSDSESDSDSDSSSSESSSDDRSESMSRSNSATAATKPPASILAEGFNHMKHINGTATDTVRKRKAEDEGPDTQEVTKSAVTNGAPGVPREGKPETKTRNVRRRETSKLKNMKERCLLPLDATLDEMRQYERDHPTWLADLKAVVTDKSASIPAIVASSKEDLSAIETLLTDDTEVGKAGTKLGESAAADTEPPSADGTVKKRKRGKNTEAGVDLNKRQDLLSAIASGGIDITTTDKSQKRAKRDQDALLDDEEPPSEISSRVQPPPLGASSDKIQDARSNQGEEVTTAQTPTPRRSRLDLSSANRLLFGGLGFKAPSTQEDRDLLQKKLAEKSKRKSDVQKQTTAAEMETEAGAEDEGDEDPEAWREKIHLTAVECCDEGTTLSTPPFPFYQRWDPQQKRKKTAKRVSGAYMNGGRRGKQNASYYQETYDKYNTDGNGDALEYDDVVDDDDEYWEEGALLGDDTEDEEAGEVFPILPKDINTLPALPEIEAKVGDFVAYSELACDGSTGWQPKTVTRLAKVAEKLDGARWILQMSSSDRATKTFDDEGNRVYDKFEMPDDDEAEEDDGRKEVAWAEMGDVKLVLREEAVEGNGEAEVKA